MKLSSFQIDALVSQIIEKHNAEYKKEKEKLFEIEKKKGRAKRYAKIIASIPKEIRRVSYLNQYNENYFVDKLVDYRKIKLKKPDRNQIRQDILVASIGANDLQELRSKINYEF